MSDIEEKTSISRERNGYEGNGWSKYQILVLQQLDDHNKVLYNLNKDINNLKQNIAVSETESKMWRTQTISTLERLIKDVDDILYDDTGLNNKIRELQKTNEVKERVTTKSKALWAMVGAVVVFFVNILAKIAELLWK